MTWLAPIGWLVAYCLFLVVFFGGSGPFANEVHYLAKSRHYWEPSWCQGDPFLESADVHVGFYLAVGWLTRWLSLPVVALVTRLASWVLIAMGWRRFCQAAGLGERDAFLAFGLTVYLVTDGNMAGEWFVGGVEGKPFCYAWVFFGLAYAWEGKWNAAWLFMGLSVFFHPVVGGWATLGLGTVAGLAWCARRQTHADEALRPSRDTPCGRSPLPFPGALAGLLAGGVIALAGLLPFLRAPAALAPAERARAEQIHVYERLPHHLVIHRMAPWNRIRFGGLIAAWFLLAWWQRREPTTRPLHLFVAYTLALTIVGMVIDRATWQHPQWGASWLKFYWYRMSDVFIPIGLAVGLFAAAHRRPVWTADALRVVVLVLLMGVAVGRFWDQRADPRPPADRQGDFGLAGSMEAQVQRYRDWQEMCQWVREHTPATALFLTPTHAQTFKWYAARPELATWKDCPQDAEGILRWRETLERIDELSLYRAVERPTSRDWQQFAHLHNVQFIVTLRELDVGALALPHVYRNGTFDIYRTIARDGSIHPPTSSNTR